MSLLQKLSGFVKTFRIRKNFPVSIADALTGFFWLCLHVATSSDIGLAHHQFWLRKPSRVGGLTESCLTWRLRLFILLWTPSSACRLPVMWDLLFLFHSFMLFKTLNTILGPSITKQNTQTNAKIDTLDAPDDEVTFGIVHSLNILKAFLALSEDMSKIWPNFQNWFPLQCGSKRC